jgi:hypothetical protein
MDEGAGCDSRHEGLLGNRKRTLFNLAQAVNLRLCFLTIGGCYRRTLRASLCLKLSLCRGLLGKERPYFGRYLVISHPVGGFDGFYALLKFIIIGFEMSRPGLFPLTGGGAAPILCSYVRHA